MGKLYLKPQPRYSEDIDLVQVKAEPIKETIYHLRDTLAWLGEPVGKSTFCGEKFVVQGSLRGADV